MFHYFLPFYVIFIPSIVTQDLDCGLNRRWRSRTDARQGKQSTSGPPSLSLFLDLCHVTLSRPNMKSRINFALMLLVLAVRIIDVGSSDRNRYISLESNRPNTNFRDSKKSILEHLLQKATVKHQ